MSTRITISQLLRNRRDWLDVSIASIVLGLSAAGASIAMGQCRPPAPCPCAADGMCYPKRETWGSYTTQWRPFPGDSLGLTPTAAEEKAADLQRELPTYIVPTPDKEDQRGPVRPTRQAAPTSTPAPVEGEINDLPPLPQNQAPAAGAAQPAEPEAEPAAEKAPGALDNLDLPGFAPPQGFLQPLPETEDGLPTLPSGLSHAITMGGGATIHANFPTTATATAMPGPSVSANSAKPQFNTALPNSQFITPATANIELANPAAMKVQKTMDQDLHQAIYYEASDIDAAMK